MNQLQQECNRIVTESAKEYNRNRFAMIEDIMDLYRKTGCSEEDIIEKFDSLCEKDLEGLKEEHTAILYSFILLTNQNNYDYD